MTTFRSISRRELLVAAGAAGGGVVAASVLDDAMATRANPPARLHDIDHVVVLMQENRSFDQYFGTLRGIRGFDDPTAMTLTTGRSVFHQPDVDLVENPSHLPYLLPWRLNTRTTSGQQAADLSHEWAVQQMSFNSGAMDGFVRAHRLVDGAIGGKVGTNNVGALTMGYFTRKDIPWHYALADAYTICDNHHCSVFGPTDPNRVMAWSATVDPEGKRGGPALTNFLSEGQLGWESYPERLQRAGIDWYLYQERDNYQDNMLPFFKGVVADKKSDLYRRANSFIPTRPGTPAGPALIAKLRHDVVTGNLPQVSWIVSSEANSEHPRSTPAQGAHFIDQCLKALQADPKVWAKTVVFLSYDENDGLFDHVVPPTPPEGTPGEWVSAATVAKSPVFTEGTSGPVGLGFRVPMVVISPFSRGGFCSSEVYDHTSTLLFLERRFGVEVNNISRWRRETVGDLTAAFNFAGGRDMSIPRLPDTAALMAAANRQASLPEPVPSGSQQMPHQEPGKPRPTPSGMVRVRRR